MPIQHSFTGGVSPSGQRAAVRLLRIGVAELRFRRAHLDRCGAASRIAWTASAAVGVVLAPGVIDRGAIWSLAGARIAAVAPSGHLRLLMRRKRAQRFSIQRELLPFVHRHRLC